MLSLLMQAAADPALNPLVSLGVGGIIAYLVVYQARQDRKDSQERFEKLAGDFRQVIQDNTKALTTLSERIAISTSNPITVRDLLEAMKKIKVVDTEPQ